jgi:DNA-binding NarL/FixJ family response regulator
MRVLLIDDEPDLRDLLTISLEIEPGCEVVGCASTLAEGAELARTTQPDVIVTDLVLGLALPPEELLGELRSSAPDAAIVVFSGKDITGSPHPVGADAVILKGGDVSELIAKVREVGSHPGP